MRKLIIAASLALGVLLVPSVALSAGRSGVSGPHYTVVGNYDTDAVQWIKVPRSPWDGAAGQPYVECLVMAGEHDTNAFTCNWTRYNP